MDCRYFSLESMKQIDEIDGGDAEELLAAIA